MAPGKKDIYNEVSYPPWWFRRKESAYNEET